MRVPPLSLISVPVAITITMGVHREEIVVQWLVRRSIWAGHVAIIPIVNVLDSLGLTHVLILMHLD